MRTALAFALLSLVCLSTASAQITNGSFDFGLTGWSSSVSGTCQISAVTYGNPFNSAWISAQNTPPDPPEGAGTMTQQFECGTSSDPGVCVISVDYILFSNENPTIAIEVVIDATVHLFEYSAPTNGWVTFTTQVPCGSHGIAIAASFQNGSASSHWSMHFDNVTASCQGVIKTSPSTWGRIKALYF